MKTIFSSGKALYKHNSAPSKVTGLSTRSQYGAYTRSSTSVTAVDLYSTKKF